MLDCPSFPKPENRVFSATGKDVVAHGLDVAIKALPGRRKAGRGVESEWCAERLG